MRNVKMNEEAIYQVCKKCGRSLPWNEKYYPKVTKEKNPRRVCRECNPKYVGFLKDGYKKPKAWSKEEELEFINIYPHYTNEELLNNFYKDLTEKQLIDKAYRLKISKTNETYWRGRKQQTPKLSAKLKGRTMSEERRAKLSETKKKQYADGVITSPWLGRIVSEEERERTRNRVKGRWNGDKNPRHKNPLFGESNGRWNGGITNLSTALRENIYEWKQESMKICNYKCLLSGKEFDNIHHTIPFNLIIKEAVNNIGVDVKTDLGSYSEENRELLIKEVQNLHSQYGIGICLNKDIHKLFHDVYSYISFNDDDFKNFIYNYFAGDYDNKLEDKLKSINSKTNLEEAMKIVSFYI